MNVNLIDTEEGDGAKSRRLAVPCTATGQVGAARCRIGAAPRAPLVAAQFPQRGNLDLNRQVAELNQ